MKSRDAASAPSGRPQTGAHHNAYMREWNAGGVLEKVVEDYLVSKVEEMGGLCLKFVSPGRRGAPDRIVCLPDRAARFVEVKRPRNGKLAPHQVRYHEALRAAGQIVTVLWTKQDVDDFLTEL